MKNDTHLMATCQDNLGKQVRAR